jgi:hypothetical protein
MEEEPKTCPVCGQAIPADAPPLPDIRPGVMLKHRLVKQHPGGEPLEMMVLELEGKGGLWFTARFPDMNTGRVHRSEVDICEPGPAVVPPHGQYL